MKILLCAVTAVCAVAACGQNAGKAPVWGYAGADGPEHWGDLSPAYGACKAGVQQSPIDIRHAQISNLPAIQFDYRPAPLKLINNGHSVQVNYASGSSITVGGQTYELRQFHFHRPSEEEIGGKRFDMVIHLVHTNAKGEYAVVAVPLEKGGPNAVLDKIWASLPKTVGQETEVPGVQINAADLLPRTRRYYTYRGSLTTPPCTEGVTWFVLKTPMSVTAQQVQTFGAIIPRNARPLQPVGSRVVRESR